jgi:hypothetical protein
MGAMERGRPVARVHGGCNLVGIVGCVKERVNLDHALAHVGGPFQDLRPNVSKEGVKAPASEDHDAVGVRVREKERHGRARANGFVSDFVGVESKDGFATECAARLAELGAYLGVS